MESFINKIIGKNFIIPASIIGIILGIISIKKENKETSTSTPAPTPAPAPKAKTVPDNKKKVDIEEN